MSENKMKYYFISIFIALVLTSCSHFDPTCLGNPYQVQQYIQGEYTCADISADYSQHLNLCGYNSHVIVGYVFGFMIPHAWVEVFHEERVYWIDPTWKWGCFPALQWKDRIAKWKYEKNVTGTEVKTYQKKEVY